MKLVAAASLTAEGRRAGRCFRQVWDGWGWRLWRTSSRGWVRTVVAAPGLGLGLGFAAGWGRGAVTGFGGCLAVVLNFGRGAGAGFARVCRRPAWPVAGCEAAAALAVAGAPPVGTGLGACLGDFAHRLGGGVLDEDVVVEVDEVLVVVEVVELEAEETDVGDGGGFRMAGAGAGFSVLWAMRRRVRVWALRVCARFPCCLVCWCCGCHHVWCAVALWSCLGCAGSWVIRGGVHFSPRTCGCACWRLPRLPKMHCCCQACPLP